MMVQSVIEIPQEPFLVKLFEHWQRSPTATIIRDRRDDDGDFTIERLLFDIHAVQKELYGSLDDEAKTRLSHPDDEVFIAIVAPGGYRYCVLFLAVYYLGATAMPLSPNILPEEAKYFFDLTSAVILLTVPSTASLGATISTTYNIPQFTFNTVPKSAVPPKFTLCAAQTPINPDRSSLVIFTSGTTGRSKGVVHSRYSTVRNLQAHGESIELGCGDLWLHYESVHRVGGFFLLFGPVLAGCCVEVCEITSTNEDRLKRLQQGDATCTFLAPSVLYQLKDTLDEMRKTGDPVRYEAAIAGIRRLRVILTGSVQLSPWIREVWAEMRGGKPLYNLYTATEMLGPVASTGLIPDADIPLNSVGRVQPQVEVKISESGEICVRKPGMFKRYIGGKSGETEASFDAEGFYKMGDTGRLDNGILYVLGRASQDVIRLGTWKMYTPDIEADISTHPLVSEAIVLGVPDPVYGEQVAVLLVLCKGHGLCHDRDSIPELRLPNLRSWLTLEKKVPPFRQPSMLRVVTSRDEVPTTETMKPIKAKIREIYFSQEQLANGEVERCEPIFPQPGAPANAFDYDGRQQ